LYLKNKIASGDRTAASSAVLSDENNPIIDFENFFLMTCRSILFGKWEGEKYEEA